MIYKLMDPPFEVKKFSDMSKGDAREHFEWFINEIPSRMSQLEKFLIYNNVISKLDYTKESLVTIWEWYIQNVEIVDKTREELMKESNLPEHVKKKMIPKKISTGWMAIAIDIGIYFAECFRKYHETICWGYVTEPKQLAHVNKPVLKGFKNGIELDPSQIINIQVLKVLKGKCRSDALLKLYDTWSNDV